MGATETQSVSWLVQYGKEEQITRNNGSEIYKKKTKNKNELMRSTISGCSGEFIIKLHNELSKNMNNIIPQQQLFHIFFSSHNYNI